jgi:hypothetical protein
MMLVAATLATAATAQDANCTAYFNDTMSAWRAESQLDAAPGKNSLKAIPGERKA